jgi:hypothetical protein
MIESGLCDYRSGQGIQDPGRHPIFSIHLRGRSSKIQRNGSRYLLVLLSFDIPEQVRGQ